jgi:glyoxylase-like metal-dependent hydrolase (beta-lactamase superfamily II)
VSEPILIHADNPGPMTGSGNNTYLLVEAGGEACLIDAGVGRPRHVAELDERLNDRRARLGKVIVTHAHADHASGAPILARIHAGASFWKYHWAEEDARYGVEWRALAEGDRMVAGGIELIVLHTPGHSPDHLVLWDARARIAYTGDLVSLAGSVMIHASKGGSMSQYLQSIERLLALRPHRLLPAHGSAIEDPSRVLKAHLAHRRLRERQVVGALEAGRNTVQAIAECIYDGLAAALMPAARENVRAHLKKLEDEGRATEHDGLWNARP